MLVYSITDDQTLEDLKSFREQILRVHSDLAVRGFRPNMKACYIERMLVI